MQARDGNTSVEVPKIMVDNVRELLSDNPMDNELLRGEEFSDLVLSKHLVAILHDFNSSPPVLTSVVVSFPGLFNAYNKLRPWVEEAAAARAMRYGAIRRVRNQAEYSAGNVSFNPHASASAQLAIADQMLNTWESRRNNYKIQMNIEGSYGVANTDLLMPSLWDEMGTISVVGGSIF